MSENIVYINQECHTGHLKGASYELGQRGLDIVELCLVRIKQVDPRYYPEFIPFRIRVSTGPGEMPERTKGKWIEAETRLGGLLNTVHTLKPRNAFLASLTEWLDEVPPFVNYFEALNYFDETERRLGYLVTNKAADKLGSIKLAAFVFLESFVLRQAVYYGRYFTRAA